MKLDDKRNLQATRTAIKLVTWLNGDYIIPQLDYRSLKSSLKQTEQKTAMKSQKGLNSAEFQLDDLLP